MLTINYSVNSITRPILLHLASNIVGIYLCWSSHTIRLSCGIHDFRMLELQRILRFQVTVGPCYSTSSLWLPSACFEKSGMTFFLYGSIQSCSFLQRSEQFSRHPSHSVTTTLCPFSEVRNLAFSILSCPQVTRSFWQCNNVLENLWIQVLSLRLKKFKMASFAHWQTTLCTTLFLNTDHKMVSVVWIRRVSL